MKNLACAEVCVETRYSLESGNNDGNWFRLADYGSLAEFFIDCSSWFVDEENPEYIYVAWDNIPDNLIRRDWICPNIFEIRDALETIDSGHIDTLLSWCKTYGWDITTDDPYKIVSDFQCSLGEYPVYECDASEQEEYSPDSYNDEYYIHTMAIQGYNTDLFDDSYS